jgi:hypothetical protein
MSKLGLTIALLPLLTISNIIMAASNLSSSSLDWQIFNSPIGLITNTTNIVPYQYTEILDDNYELIKFRYNFTTGNFPQV